MNLAPTAAPPDGPGDPRHLIEQWHLPDGTPVTIRAIRPVDLALESTFAAGLSPATGYQRLLSTRRPQPEELWRFTHVDYHREMALIALADLAGARQQLAVARYVRDSIGTQAEFAIVVADAWQGSGLGTKLLRSLIRAAMHSGVHRLSDITLSSNQGMLALARKLGFELRRDRLDATITHLGLELLAFT
jgi:acetyltransferase